MKSIYHKETNSLREQMASKEPDIVDYWNDGGSWLSVNSEEIFLKNKEVYEKQKATLRSIPCSPDCNFEDGKEYSEGVHYDVKETCIPKEGFKEVWGYIAIPIKEDESELWKEFYNEAHKKNLYSFIECCKQKYSITRK